MKIRLLLLLFSGILIFLSACQKELSIELSGSTSTGTLQADGSGECLPKTIQGVYETGKVLNAATDFIDVQVNATTVGTYRIYSDTVNGIFFEGKGSIATAGLNTIRLAGNGTPLNAGVSQFTINYSGTTCVVAIIVQSPGGTGNAEFTLAGAPDACQTPVIAGDYVVGQAMAPANTVTLSVNVTVAGNYTIATTPSNGITFAASGTFANTGTQTVTLTATGIPAVASATNFSLTGASNSCFFSIDVTDVATFDYFPLTAGSNWSYQFDDVADDSLLIRSKPGTVDLGGNAFTIFEATVDEANDGFQDISAHRKSGGDYFTYLDVGQFFGFDDDQPAELIFLKDNLAAGGTWQSPGFTGDITDTSGTLTFTVRFSYTIAQKDVNITVNGVDYPNTIVVNEKYELQSAGNWVDATPLIGYYKSYYARGVGMIKQEYYYEDGNANPGDVILTQDLRRYVIL